MGRLSSLFLSSAKLRSRARPHGKHHRPLRPLLELLERRELLATFATLEDKPLIVSDPTLANIVIVANPAHGTVSLTDLGGFVYKPAENYNGTDAFVYGRPAASNTTVGETVTAAITVTPVNDAPSGTDKAVTLLEDSSYTFQAADFGFTDPKDSVSNNFQTLRIATIPEKGKLFNSDVPVVSGQVIPLAAVINNQLRYVPATNGSGTPYSRFTFQVQDDGGTANGGVDLDPTPNTIVLNVTPVNDAPRGADAVRTIPQNASYFVFISDFGFSDPSDSPNNSLKAVQIVSLPAKGQLLDGDVSVVVGQSIPLADFVGSNAAGTVQGSRVKYVPDATSDGLGSFSITFAVQDNGGVANGGIDLDPEPNNLTINVKPTPMPPAIIANNDTYLAAVNGKLEVGPPGVLKNDFLAIADPTTGTTATGTNPLPNAPLTAVLLSQPANGTVELHSDGSFRYVPKADFAGTDTFTYQAVLNPTATSAATATPSAPATVTINVKPLPASPVAIDDTYSTNAGQILRINAPGVIANDIKADGSALLAVIGTRTSHGNLEFRSDGSFTYLPASGFVGDDTFTYQVLEVLNSPAPPADDPNHYLSNFATVTIHVKPIVTVPPIANNDQFQINQGTVLVAEPPGVLVNDKPIDGHKLAAKLLANVTHGTLNFTESGGFTYTPASGFSGVDSFTYYAIDVPPSGTTAANGTTGNTTTDPLKSNVATVKIYVQATGIRVFAFDDEFKVLANTMLTIDKPGVLANDRTLLPPVPATTNVDTPNGDPNSVIDPTTGQPRPVSPTIPLSAKLLTDPSNGTVTLSTDGSFNYTPKPNFVGVDTFTYRASAQNSPPAGTSATLTATDSTSSLLVCTDNTICQPLPDDIATVRIIVRAPEPPPGPVAVNDFYLTAQNTPLSIELPGVLANDYVRGGVVAPSTDANGISVIKLPLTATLIAGPANGTLSLDPDGSFKYLPNKDFVGTDTFTYQDTLATNVPTLNGSTATDFAPVTSNIATVTIRVVPAVARNDSFTTDRDKPLEIASPGVLANDSGGSDAHPLIASLLSGPLHGTLKLNDDGSFRYEPAAGYVGADTFSYRSGDGQPTTDPATGALAVGTNGDANRPMNAYNIGVVKIYVRPTNTGPAIQAHDDKYPALKNTTLTIDSPGVLANDYGPVNVPVVAAVVNKPVHGTLTLNEKGGFTYIPAADFVGEDKFTYRASVGAATPGAADSNPGTTNSSIQSGLATVTIYVMAPDAPTPVIIGRDQKTTDESGPQRVTDFAAIVAIGADGKPPAIVVTTDKPNLFTDLPRIDAAGQLVYAPAPNVSGTATITVNVGDPTNGDATQTTTFAIQVDKPHALYNAALPCDVTDDNEVAADDALAVINYINAHGDQEAAVPSTGGQLFYYDVDKDDVVAAMDVLAIINHLNARSTQPESEASAAAVDQSLLALVAQDAADATTGKRKV